MSALIYYVLTQRKRQIEKENYKYHHVLIGPHISMSLFMRLISLCTIILKTRSAGFFCLCLKGGAILLLVCKIVPKAGLAGCSKEGEVSSAYVSGRANKGMG